MRAFSLQVQERVQQRAENDRIKQNIESTNRTDFCVTLPAVSCWERHERTWDWKQKQHKTKPLQQHVWWSNLPQFGSEDPRCRTSWWGLVRRVILPFVYRLTHRKPTRIILVYAKLQVSVWVVFSRTVYVVYLSLRR